jgi:hypothetical protein
VVVRTELVSGETSVTILRSSWRDTAREKDIETEKECDSQRGKTNKAREILGQTLGSNK